MCAFVREKTLLEAIASSLTELFSPVIISERMDGMLAHYDFVTRETLSYFEKRPPQAAKDSDFALDYVKRHARTPDAQALVLAALEFKCSVLWAMLDALRPRLCRARAYSAGRVRAGRAPMTEPAAPGTTISADAKPRLPRGVRLTHNEAQGGWVLLAPERIFKADAIAVEILKRCTGEATLRCDRRRSRRDLQGAARAHRGGCRELLRSLADKRLLDLS